jgi:hypothetical protein
VRHRDYDVFGQTGARMMQVELRPVGESSTSVCEGVRGDRSDDGVQTIERYRVP